MVASEAQQLSIGTASTSITQLIGRAVDWWITALFVMDRFTLYSRYSIRRATSYERHLVEVGS